MAQPQPAAPRRPKGGKRRSRRRGGVSPFVIMAVVGVIFIGALLLLNSASISSSARNARSEGRTLVQAGANPVVTLEEYSDFQ